MKEIHEQLNELGSRQLALLSEKARSDRAALDYVKSLPGFAEAYPEFARAHAQIMKQEQEVESELAEVKSEWALRIGEPVAVGDIILHNGVRYTVLQTHVLQGDWVPGEVPALYKPEGQEGDEFPEWKQPVGASNAYAKGSKVTYHGKHYESLIDGNVWAPDVYPQGWKEVE